MGYRQIIPIIPIKLVSAVSTTLVILLTISLGGGATEVGYVVSLTFIGNLIGALLWSRVIPRKGSYVAGIILGYLLLSIVMSLLIIREIYVIYLASFTISILTNLIYFSLLYHVVDILSDEKDRGVGRLETIGGWSWVAGLIFGAVTIDTLDLTTLVTILSGILFSSIIISIIVLVTGLKEKIKEMVEEEEGLLPLLDKGIEKIVDMEERLPDIIYSGIHVIYGGALFFSPAYLHVKIPSRERILHYMGILMMFLSFGIVYTQLIKNIKDIGFSDSAIYFFSLLGSIFSALTYSRAGGPKPVERFLRAGIIRTLIFLFLPLLTVLSLYLVGAILILFYVVSGLTWAYLVINLNLVSLKRGKEEVGTANFFSNLGLFIGAFISGLLATYLGYNVIYLLSSLLLAIGVYITYSANKVVEPEMEPFKLKMVRISVLPSIPGYNPSKYVG